jgi:LysR family transcriptional regulator, transcription activator of glutamate synthase operon
MEFHQLQCFIAVIEEGGFNRATSRLFITQPALSYQIKQLEEELGAPLFYRRPRGITPTEVGRTLFVHAREVMEAVKKSKRAVEMLTKGVSGEIRIGAINSVGVSFLPPVLSHIKEIHPMTRLSVMYGRAPELMEALLTNQVDIAIVANPRPNSRLNLEPLFDEKVSIVCNKSHPFFEKKNIRPEDLNGQPFVMLTEETPTGDLVRDYLARMGVAVDVVVTTPDVDTVRRMVEVGLGLGFLPDMVTSLDVACDGGPVGEIARVNIRPVLSRRIEVVTWKEFQCNEVTQAFIETLREHGEQWKACVC